MRVLVIGADGRIGRAFAVALRERGDAVIPTSRRPGAEAIALDLADPGCAETALPDADVAFICAAMGGFANCRLHPEDSLRVNVTGPAALASRLTGRGIPVVLLSSSAVFDGATPEAPSDHPIAPTSVYGRHKAMAEAAVLALGPLASVLRLGKVLAADMPLLAGWVDALAEGRGVTAFTDLHCAPMTTGDAVTALLAVAARPDGGIFQYSAAADLSYFELAGSIAATLGAPAALVRPGSARAAGIPPEEAPRYTSMESGRVLTRTGGLRPDPATVIREICLQRLAARAPADQAAG